MMKQVYLTVIAMLLLYAADADTYYVSNTGSDANSGTSTGAAWQSIAKVNAVATSGDVVLFARGSSFYGTIRPKANNITYDAYGTGPLPVITGLETITVWTNAGGGKYSKAVTGIKNYCNIVLVNGVARPIARTPNSTYWYNNGGTSSSLVYSLLSGQPSFVGGDIVAFKNGWRIDRGRITSQSSSTINYVPQRGITSVGNNVAFYSQATGYGFFVQNHEACLDAFGEWRVDSSNGSLRMFFGSANPADYTIQATTLDTLVNIGNRQQITLRHLKFTGANVAAVHALLGNSITVEDCEFAHNTMATYIWNCSNTVIQRNSYKHSLCQAIRVANRERVNVTVSDNVIDSTALLAGHGAFASTMQYKAVSIEVDSIRAGNSNIISGNRVTNTGHGAIEFQGTNFLIEKNFTSRHCRVLEDHGGIYSFTRNDGTPPTKIFTNRLVRHNIIVQCPGADVSIKAVPEPDVVGLYLDDQTQNVYCEGNTVADIAGPGFQLNNPVNVVLRGNTVYNCVEGVLINAKDFSAISGLEIKRNVFFSTNNTQAYLRYWDGDLRYPVLQTLAQSVIGLGAIDSNYIHCTRSNWLKLWYFTGSGSTVFSNLSYAAWQSTYGKDVNSSVAPVPVTGHSFMYNDGLLPVSGIFTGLRKMDMLGQVYDNSVMLEPFESIILIDNGMASGPPPLPVEPEDIVPGGFIIVSWVLE
ncbi:MAG TPA: right-handed parallel beta-helix repeat-containing protein [Ferruginibacter sp.]|nr:right-handed parallel beta-helix repeat-containing protein [Ferruginibacter sp.]HMP22157.1 right-handed parallel beta-helix repeat-containing protein [Ferruginibacter sp.]